MLAVLLAGGAVGATAARAWIAAHSRATMHEPIKAAASSPTVPFDSEIRAILS